MGGWNGMRNATDDVKTSNKLGSTSKHLSCIESLIFSLITHHIIIIIFYYSKLLALFYQTESKQKTWKPSNNKGKFIEG